ncbi:MAG: hypothetical protein KDD67_06970 [Ignavibacteriae bacterium]|nr:hypothetical protein [Ignavibacteriota bacterium]MCB9215218.1 hypothetical protein [Ignavibacteria bacterium]
MQESDVKTPSSALKSTNPTAPKGLPIIWPGMTIPERKAFIVLLAPMGQNGIAVEYSLRLSPRPSRSAPSESTSIGFDLEGSSGTTRNPERLRDVISHSLADCPAV